MVDSIFVKDFVQREGIYLYRSTSSNVYLNLAREEFLFDNLPSASCGFLLYLDSPAVVFGKHQNPWQECSVVALRRRGVPLARRISGGGTVYHDLGNLNFSFILPKEEFDRRANLTIVVTALKRLGVEAQISERHDIVVGERKVSGNAFCFRRQRALHHGTLLIRSRLEALQGALRGSQGIETFAVASNPSAVANLSELKPGLDVAAIERILTEEVVRSWSREGAPGRRGGLPVVRLEESKLEIPQVRSLADRNGTVEWILDRTPRFTITFDVPSDVVSAAGLGARPERLTLAVDKGHVVSVAASSVQSATLSRCLEGVRFDSRCLSEGLAQAPEFSSLSRWLSRQRF